MWLLMVTAPHLVGSTASTINAIAVTSRLTAHVYPIPCMDFSFGISVFRCFMASAMLLNLAFGDTTATTCQVKAKVILSHNPNWIIRTG